MKVYLYSLKLIEVDEISCLGHSIFLLWFTCMLSSVASRVLCTVKLCDRERYRTCSGSPSCFRRMRGDCVLGKNVVVRFGTGTPGLVRRISVKDFTCIKCGFSSLHIFCGIKFG